MGRGDFFSYYDHVKILMLEPGVVLFVGQFIIEIRIQASISNTKDFECLVFCN